MNFIASRTNVNFKFVARFELLKLCRKYWLQDFDLLLLLLDEAWHNLLAKKMGFLANAAKSWGTQYYRRSNNSFYSSLQDVKPAVAQILQVFFVAMGFTTTNAANSELSVNVVMGWS